jgi:hypothetical protein
VGPVCGRDQEEKILRCICIGKEGGANLVAGGSKLTGDPYDKGYFVEPTIFEARNGMRITKEEIFGPVLSVIKSRDYPGVLQKASEEIYLNTYLDYADTIREDFLRPVELFRARTNLCIASYLISLGLGHTENLWRVLVEAEKAMAQFMGWENRGGQVSGQARNLDLAA